MITTNGLKDFDHHQFAPEISHPRSVLGYSPLPRKWKDKLSEVKLEGAILANVDDVHLCGAGLVGFKQGTLILDTAYYGRIDLYERNYPYFLQAFHAFVNEPEKEIEVAVSMGGVWSHNYFHWVLDHLPKLQLLEPEKPPLLLSPDPPAFVVDSLSMLGYEVVPYSPHFFVKNLLVPTTRRYKGRLYPSAARWLTNVSNHRDPVRRLYIDRSNAGTRRVVNNDAVKDMLIGHGFDVVAPEEYKFTEQTDIFGQAEMVIAPHGAGLANIAWAPEGVKVLELVTPKYDNPCCWLVGDALGADYRFLLCEPTGDEDLFVDTERLDMILGMWY